MEKGRDWGRPGFLPASALVATSDHDAARLLERGESMIGIDDGDLARTLGIRRPYDRSSPKHLVPIDAISVELDDGSTHIAVAHVLLGHPVASAECIAVMNAAFWSGRNIAPRAHPGDGKVDVVHLRLAGMDRIKAWRRMTTGTHVPHPAIKIRRSGSGQGDTDRSRSVWVDGHRVGRSRSVRYEVRPEAFTIGVS